jgi:hypothetical protein
LEDLFVKVSEDFDFAAHKENLANSPHCFIVVVIYAGIIISEEKAGVCLALTIFFCFSWICRALRFHFGKWHRSFIVTIPGGRADFNSSWLAFFSKFH